MVSHTFKDLPSLCLLPWLFWAPGHPGNLSVGLVLCLVSPVQGFLVMGALAGGIWSPSLTFPFLLTGHILAMTKVLSFLSCVPPWARPAVVGSWVSLAEGCRALERKGPVENGISSPAHFADRDDPGFQGVQVMRLISGGGGPG